jgi:fimbrial chaperone protein
MPTDSGAAILPALKLLAAMAIALVCTTPLRAASLEVQPALVEVMEPGAVSVMTLRNRGPRPINVQLRVYRWFQSNGEEHLLPTEDLVASPPLETLLPGAEYNARLIRVAKTAVDGEEAYRLLVDELPDAALGKTNSVKALIRHSIPVFFGDPDRKPPRVDWSIRKQGERVILAARNQGDSRLRISTLSLRDRAGKAIFFPQGLVGYSLGRSRMRWTAPAPLRGFAASGLGSIDAQGNEAPIPAAAQVTADP